jgi:hypothetical protein
MYVNSPGGSVTAGMAVFDTMRFIRPDVSTVCVGLAASMGAFLLASGAQGKRYSLPNSRIMIHQPLGGAQGQAADIEIQANEILHHKLTLNGYLAEFSGKSFFLPFFVSFEIFFRPFFFFFESFFLPFSFESSFPLRRTDLFQEKNSMSFFLCPRTKKKIKPIQANPSSASPQIPTATSS